MKPTNARLTSALPGFEFWVHLSPEAKLDLVRQLEEDVVRIKAFAFAELSVKPQKTRNTRNGKGAR